MRRNNVTFVFGGKIGFIDMKSFQELALRPELANALVNGKFTAPTPIQAQAIPLALAGHDILGLAQTGTGKTLAFGVPIIEAALKLHGKPAPKTTKALILAPTRELLNQIAQALRSLSEHMKMRVNTVVGGASVGKQMQTLARGSDILVATPGRLIDLLERDAIDLSQTGYLVLDEADQMLDIGFIHALRKIVPYLNENRQTQLFSATMSKQMEQLSGVYLKNPRKVQVNPPGAAAEKIEQTVRYVEKPEKPALLREVLDAHQEVSTLVFARTKHGAERLKNSLVTDGYRATSIHGNKSQGQRDRAIKQFRSGEKTVLVATDVAARGIDIPSVGLVVNYELPNVPENYVHRIGRTARAGRSGLAVTFCSSEEAKQLRDVEKLVKTSIEVIGDVPAQLSSIAAETTPSKSPKKKRRKNRGKAWAQKSTNPRGKPAHKSRPKKRQTAA